MAIRGSVPDHYGEFFRTPTAATLKAMRQTIRGWRLQLKNDKTLDDLSAMLGPVLGGWHQYYGHFQGSELKSVWNQGLIGWLMRKHKKLARRAAGTLRRLAQHEPRALINWSLGFMT